MDTSLNFVALVETNPITRLTQTYNNRFVNKINDIFTETEQRMFVASLYCFLNHHPINDFVIDLDNIWQWLGFSQKAMAKRLLETHFILDTDYKRLLCRSAEQRTEGRGGHNKETILLNVRTFKRLCMKASTKKADEIHEYFAKLEELLHTIVLEESDELKHQLQQSNQQLIQTQQDTETIVQLERQKMLLREYGSNINIVYILRIKQLDNRGYIIKIGESRRGIEGRFNEHRAKYEDPLLLDCFAVKKCRDFEQFLHNHDVIRPHRVNDLPGHETENELFQIGSGLTYTTLVKIIQTNLSKFNEVDEKYMEDLILSAVTKILHQNTPTQQLSAFQEILQNQERMLHTIQRLEANQQLIQEKLQLAQTRTVTNFHVPLATLGPRLQQINPDTMTIHCHYESVNECIELSNHQYKRPSIDKAVKENTVYRGYRWNYVNRDQDPTITYNLLPTRVTQDQQTGYVAKLNHQKTEILNVYLDRKTAALANGYGISGLDLPVKRGTLTQGHYYIPYDQCDDDLKQSFTVRNHHQPPLLYKGGVGQYNTSNELVHEFTCKYDCMKKLKISDKTLAKALDKQVLYNNHYYRTLGSKTIAPYII
jgi:hypothetical protein